MPLHSYTIKRGSTGRTLLVYARDPWGAGAAGLDPAAAQVAYVRDIDAAATPLDATKVLSEVDGSLVPGVYRVELPDAALAPGATRVVVVVRHPDAGFEPVDIDLVAFDPLDSIRLGMSALGPEERITALRGAFPRLAEMEMREREAIEGGVD
ncbi:hypothetical protein BH24ACT7_BH24ACT7_18440 [soil metagenome]